MQQHWWTHWISCGKQPLPPPLPPPPPPPPPPLLPLHPPWTINTPHTHSLPSLTFLPLQSLSTKFLDDNRRWAISSTIILRGLVPLLIMHGQKSMGGGSEATPWGGQSFGRLVGKLMLKLCSGERYQQCKFFFFFFFLFYFILFYFILFYLLFVKLGINFFFFSCS